MKKPKEDPGVEVDRDDYYEAAIVWHSFWFKQGKTPPNFPNFLGMSGGPDPRHLRSFPNQPIMLRASAAKKIAKLKGPYSYTLLKAYQIRKNI